jgi:hypothetical protein
VTQRWRLRRDRYRPEGETIDPSKYGVELLDSDKVAKAFVLTHHYAGSYPAARLRVGLYRTRSPSPPELVGVAVFSVGSQKAALPYWTGTTQGVELGRFVLHDSVPGMGETWFLARAFRLLQGELPEVRAVLAYSDPLPRTRADGVQITPGHIGLIYQGHNAHYAGRARADTILLDRDARTVCARALGKLKKGERGADGVYEDLLERGAPARREGESAAAYVARLKRADCFRKVRHPGNHAYMWAVGPEETRELTRAAFRKPQPYPRRPGDPRDPQGALWKAA